MLKTRGAILLFSLMPMMALAELDPLADIDIGTAGDVLGDAKDGLNSQQKNRGCRCKSSEC